MTFAKAVQILLKVLVLNDVSVTYGEYLNSEKTPYVIDSNFGTLLCTAGKHLTGQALRLMYTQIKKLDTEQTDFSEKTLADGEYVLRNLKTMITYSLQEEVTINFTTNEKDTMITCSCFFSCTFGLPCRHVMSHRQTLITSVFSFEDCQNRWFRKFTGPDIEFMRSGIFLLAEQGVENVEAEFNTAVKHQAVPKERRYNKALVIAKDMASVVSEYGGSSFGQRLTVLEKMLELLEKNLSTDLLHKWLDKALRNEQPDQLAENSVSDINEYLAVTVGEPQEGISESENKLLQVLDKTQSANHDTNKQIQIPFKIARQPIKVPGRPKQARPKPSSSSSSTAAYMKFHPSRTMSSDALVGLGPSNSKPTTKSIAKITGGDSRNKMIETITVKFGVSSTTGRISKDDPFSRLKRLLPKTWSAEDVLLDYKERRRNHSIEADLKEMGKFFHEDALAAYAARNRIEDIDDWFKEADILAMDKEKLGGRNFWNELFVCSAVDYRAMRKIFEVLGKPIATRTCFWCRPGGILLGWFHRHIIIELESIEGRGWLDNHICDAAMAMLKNQYRHIHGLVSSSPFYLPPEDSRSKIHKLRTQEFQVKPFAQGEIADTQTIQIFNAGGNHWVTMTCPFKSLHNSVAVYDNLGLAVNDFTATQIAASVRFSSSVKTLHYNNSGGRQTTKRKRLRCPTLLLLLWLSVKKKILRRWSSPEQRSWRDNDGKFPRDRGTLTLADVSFFAKDRVRDNKKNVWDSLQCAPATLLNLVHWMAWEKMSAILNSRNEIGSRASQQICWLQGSDFFLSYDQRLQIAFPNLQLDDEVLNLGLQILKHQAALASISGLDSVNCFTLTGGFLKILRRKPFITCVVERCIPSPILQFSRTERLFEFCMLVATTG
ncbi:hypothetical protein BV898_17893 [Hypsibius exemplaris]|uniref:SWIM-type domain-containing protein n=1 Tax=Hypsibius exemplaris TaxID=2072580 RepID=A0A9X6RMX8_HYPEX|nr:hypothetical protein BV898_17893 [Hypsibius exemplaris]